MICLITDRICICRIKKYRIESGRIVISSDRFLT